MNTDLLIAEAYHKSGTITEADPKLRKSIFLAIVFGMVFILEQQRDKEKDIEELYKAYINKLKEKFQ